MFKFLKVTSVLGAILLLFFALTKSNAVLAILGVQGIFNAIVFAKLEKMEIRSAWLSGIAKSKGFADPTEIKQSNDIYKGEGR